MSKVKEQRIMIEPDILAKFIAKEVDTLDEKSILNAIVKYRSIKPYKKSPPSDWDSKNAKELAEENDLTPNDFPIEERNGRTLKSGLVRISVNDVRRKAGTLDNLGEKAFTSPGVYKLAQEHNLSPSSFNVKGRISKSDVQKLISKMKTEGGSDTE